MTAPELERRLLALTPEGRKRVLHAMHGWVASASIRLSELDFHCGMLATVELAVVSEETYQLAGNTP